MNSSSSTGRVSTASFSQHTGGLSDSAAHEPCPIVNFCEWVGGDPPVPGQPGTTSLPVWPHATPQFLLFSVFSPSLSLISRALLLGLHVFPARSRLFLLTACFDNSVPRTEFRAPTIEWLCPMASHFKNPNTWSVESRKPKEINIPVTSWYVDNLVFYFKKRSDKFGWNWKEPNFERWCLEEFVSILYYGFASNKNN